MKIENLYIKPDGQIYACIVPVPEEPKEWLDDEGYMASLASPLYARKMKEYRQALKACKESAVLFDNQEAATRKFGNILFGHITINDIDRYKNHYFEKDTFYPLQCSIHIVEQKRYRMSYQKNDWTDWTCEVPNWVIPSIEYETRKVARLIPEAKPVSPIMQGLVESIASNYAPAPIVEESHTIKIEVNKNTIPRNAKLVEAYETEHRIIIMFGKGEIPESHSCDEMGCGSFSHVKYILTKP